MFLALISISEVKGQDDIFCPAAVTVTYMLPVQDGTLLRGPPSLSSKLIMNQSVWNIYGCSTPPTHFLPWGQLEHPWWPLLSESGKPLALSYQYSSVDLQLRRVRLLFPHIANLHSPACVGDGMLTASPPCSQTHCCLPLSVFFYFFFFFSRGKGFLIPGMPEKGPLRITLAKPLSLQEIHCLLKKVVGVENQGEVLFFLSFSLFPWKVITGLKKSPFFGTQVFS